MFDPISMPFGAKMRLNTVKLKHGVTLEEAEIAVLAAMCSNSTELGYDMLWQGEAVPAADRGGNARTGGERAV